MSFIRVRDQHGNPPPTCSHGIRERLFVQLIPDSIGTPMWDEFTDDGGQRSFPPDSMQLWPSPNGYTLAVNEQNVNPNYKTARAHVVDLEAGIVDILVERVGTPGPPPPGPITGNGTCDEWKTAVAAIFAAHGLGGPGPEHGADGTQAPNLRATQREIQLLHPSPYVRWQFNSGGDLRPRLFLPNPGNDPFARSADIGDWNGPMRWEHCT